MYFKKEVLFNENIRDTTIRGKYRGKYWATRQELLRPTTKDFRLTTHGGNERPKIDPNRSSYLVIFYFPFFFLRSVQKETEEGWNETIVPDRRRYGERERRKIYREVDPRTVTEERH